MGKCISVTMLGETAYTLKDIEINEGIKVNKLRTDIKNGILQVAGKICGTSYYIVQSELNKYLRVVKKEIEISESQIDNMRHSLGLNYSKKPYRNRFYCCSNNKNWNDLVEKGLAQKSEEEKGQCCFCLTELGVAFILGRSLSREKYKEL